MTQPLPADPESAVHALDQCASRCRTEHAGAGIVWRSWGSGPPLVLFHGATGSWSHWIRNIEALGADRTLWVPDLPGHGDSDLPPAIDHATIGDALAHGLREVIGDDLPVDLVGFSFGGIIATHLVARHPDVVRRLVLVDTGGLGTPRDHPQLQRVRGLEGEERIAAMRSNLMATMLKHSASVDELAMHLLMANSAKSRMATSLSGLILPAKLLEALPGVHCPIDVIWGELDQMHFDPQLQIEAIRAIRPDASLRVVPDAGHWVMYERPEAFDATLREVLAGTA